jgi:hypothetical protein
LIIFGGEKNSHTPTAPRSRNLNQIRRQRSA